MVSRSWPGPSGQVSLTKPMTRLTGALRPAVWTRLRCCGNHPWRPRAGDVIKMPRPILVGIVGDSAAGKTTLTRGLVRILGERHVAHVSADHYHRYNRRQRTELGLTPLHPDCNYIDILEQHVLHLRAGKPLLKPVYRHQDGTFQPPEYVPPARFAIVEG